MGITNPNPTPEQFALIAQQKDAFAAMERRILAIPANRERSLALTKLEEASMWTTKAILEAPPPPAAPPEQKAPGSV